jgi:hypothetical protein
MNILATGCNNSFFNSCKTLLSSCYHFAPFIEKIYIFNLGLDQHQIDELNSYKNVEIKEISQSFIELYPHVMVPKIFFWKIYILKMLTENFGNNVFYMDAGACFVNHAQEVYDIVNRDDILLVGDTHKNHQFTHNKCREIMNVSEPEINGNHLWAGFQCYKSKGKYQVIIDDAFEYGKNKECIDGHISIHRHDQSIFSILSIRYNAPRQSISKFGGWVSQTQFPDQIIYAHRNKYFDHSHLIKRV